MIIKRHHPCDFAPLLFKNPFPAINHPARGGIALVLFVIILMALAGTVLGWMILAPGITARRVQMSTGFTCELGSYAANPFGGSLSAGDFVLRNPDGFSQRVFLRGRNLKAGGRSGLPAAVGGRDGLDFQRVTLELDSVVLAFDADGRDNFSAFASTLPPLRIRELSLVVSSMPAAAGYPEQPGREAFAKTYRDLDSLRPVLADLARLATPVRAENAIVPAPPVAPGVPAAPPAKDEAPKIEFRLRP